MAFTIPYSIDEVPFRLDGLGHLEVCEKKNAAFFAEVHVRVDAEAADEWEVKSVTVGEQRLSGQNEMRMAKVIADFYDADISDHVGENLPSIPKSRFLRQMMGA
jgi:hypothetical protein